MNNYSYLKTAIKERVSMRDVVNLYVPSPAPRHNRIPCPIHSGDDYNLHFSDNLYHCFVCKSGGDVVDFVQHALGLDFIPALERINADFNLGIPTERRMTLREQRKAKKQYDAFMAEQKRKEAEKQAYEELYWQLWGEWIRMDVNRMKYKPQSPDEELHPLFVEALQKMDYYSYLIDSQL